MPSKKKAGTVRILSQIPELVHQVADKRRRAEGLTWDALLVTLLTRWAAGADDGALAAPMRATRSRATGPDAEAFRALVAKAMLEDPAYRKAATEKVNPSTLTYASLGELVRARASQAGRTLPGNLLKELDKEERDSDV